MPEDHTAVRARVTGRVQGVSYRVWVRAEAERRGLTGWVRNERDGSVTALVVGPEAQVAEIIAALWLGPPGAVVSDVAAQRVEPGERPVGFRITR